ncbi:FAD-dependent oxidoreductase [uncultured Thalassospira sp.]|uniref:NAD(P)/FAD-dependent oxidoreductase n=1 Tax=uncultured Thalassospira sp. TaxID=404382 RepID=UPI0025969712|nr:FAD-dependent oxidoreductase [uncultured Thalassospira sp.]
MNHVPANIKTAKSRLVVIGNGMAGMRTVEEILNRAPDKYDITVFGAEPRVNYNRIMLSPLLSGEKNFDEIVINTPEWYRENNIHLYSGDPVVEIDRIRKVVISKSGTETEYDRLLLATGSDPIIIPVPGHKLSGVVTFRDVDDVDVMLGAAAKGGPAVVIGGGLLGLEAAVGLQARGMDVTVLHLAGHVMERQLDPSAGYLLAQELERRGITVITEADTAEIVGTETVTGVRLKDGRMIPADLVVMAVGIRPNGRLAADTGIAVERGIVVDDVMTTSDPAIFAVGECVQHRGQCYGLVAPLFEMAKSCADHLTEIETDGYAGSVTSTKLKVTGIDLFSAGDFMGDDSCDIVTLRDPQSGSYRKLVIRDDVLVGACLYGDTRNSSWYIELVRSGQRLAAQRDLLMFGEALASSAIEAAADPDLPMLERRLAS